jgi:DHA1 family tetracycline resistance protein-like MFS transporter
MNGEQNHAIVEDVEMSVAKEFPENSVSEYSLNATNGNTLKKPLTGTIKKENNQTDAPKPSVLKQLSVIYVILSITLFSFAVSSAIIPLYGISLGATTFLIGLISSVSGVAGILGTYMLGYLADLPRIGRRLSNIIQTMGVPIGFLFIVSSNSLATLYAGVIVNSLLTTGVSPVAAYIADVTNPGEERTKYFAYTGAFTGLAFTVGGILSVVFLTVGWSLKQLFTFSLIGGTISFLVALIFLKEPEVNRTRTTEIDLLKVTAKADSLKFSDISRHHWFLFIAMLTCFYSYSGPFSVVSVLVLRNFDWNATQLAMLLVAAGLVFAITQVFVHMMVKKFSHQKLSVVFTFILGFSMALIPFMPTPFLFVLAFALAVMSISVISTTIPVQLSQETSQSRQGQIQSLSQICQTVAGIVSSLVVGALFDRDTGRIAYAHAGLIAILGSGVLLYDLLFQKKQQPEPERHISRADPFLDDQQRKSRDVSRSHVPAETVQVPKTSEATKDEETHKPDALETQMLKRMTAASRMSIPVPMA